MRIKIWTLTLSILAVTAAHGACETESESQWVNATETNFNMATIFQSMMYDDLAHCWIDWGDFQEYSIQVFYSGGNLPTTYNGTPPSGVISGHNINIYEVVRQAYAMNSNNVNNCAQIQIKITGYFDNFWTTQAAGYKLYLNIKNPHDVTLTNALCSGIENQLYDFITASPGYPGETIVFSGGGGWDSIPQTQNNLYSYEYRCQIGGFTAIKFKTSTLNELKQAYFVSTAETGGPVTALSTPSLMTDYTYSDGGEQQFLGSGIIQNGPTYYFDPGTANVGNNIVYVKTVNGGCVSDWRDTVFYVTPIVTNFNSPIPDLVPGFGTPGFFASTNTNGTAGWNGKFHYGCAGSTYTIGYMPGTLDPGLTVDYQVVFHNSVIESGNVPGWFSVTMPPNDQIYTNQVSSVYTEEDHFLDPNLYYNMLLVYSTGEDIDGSGTIDSDDLLLTRHTGDLVKIMIRARNVFNDVSDWYPIFIGLAPTPEVINNDVLCYVGDPTLSPVTPTPIYNDSINYNSLRSVLWDIDMDGSFELDGTIDDINFPMMTNQKRDLMRSQIVDSIKMYGYNYATNAFYTYYSPQISTVCYSNIDTINLIRKPIFTPTFSVMDTISVGTPVQGYVDGTWFSHSEDSIVWSWSDGTPNYFGDTVWHFYNDLGDYSLEITIHDSLGCYSDTVIVNGWHVPGVLNVDLPEKDLEVSIYPVPVIDMLTVESEFKMEEIEIYDSFGKLVLFSKETIVDCKNLTPGIYFVRIESEKGIVERKIIKQ